MADSSEPLMVEYAPEQCGWTRAKGFDKPGTKAYEQPNGKIYYFSSTQKAKVVKLRRPEG